LTQNNYKRNFSGMSLATRIKAARAHAGLTQEQLSKASGVAQQVISKLENGKQLETSGIVKIARACKVNADWLEDETGRMLAVSTDYDQPEYIRQVIEAMRVMQEPEQYLAARLVETIASPVPPAIDTATAATASAPDMPAPTIEKPAPQRPASASTYGPSRSHKKSHTQKKTA
jgi:transcriptional regulator with XRE-family HTH domain